MNKLIIDKVILKNWGPYYGKHTAQFSSNPDKNVTYFLGKNSTGKTKLFEAVKWVLFLDKKVNHISKINTEAKAEADVDNELNETRVELYFNILDEITGQQKNFHIRRSFKYDRKIRDIEFFGSWTEDISSEPNIIKEKPYIELIKELIPKGPRDFYFLDGEQLVSLFKINIEIVKDLTIEQSIVPIINKMIKGLRSRKNEIIKHLKTLGKKDDNLKKWTDNLNNLNKKFNNLQLEKENFENDKQKYNKKLAKIEKKLIGIEPGIKEEIDDVEGTIKEKDRKFIEINKEINKILEFSGTHILLEDVYNWCLKDLNEKKQEKVIPSYIDDKVIDEIKELEECVCGNPINDPQKEILDEFKKNIPKGEINQAVIKFRAWLENKIEIIQENKAEIQILNDERKILKFELENLKKEKAIKIKSVSEFNLDLIEKMESFHKRINELTVQIEKKNENIKDIEKEVSIANRMISKTKTELERASSGDLVQRLDDLTDEKEVIEDTEKILENIEKETIEFIRNYIEEKTSEKYLKFIWNTKEWSGIKIDDQWNFFGIQKIGHEIEAPDLSKGQRHVLAISYMSSLPLVTTIDLPFLFDSPFGGISEEPIQHIGKFLPEILKGSQIILFVTDTEHNSVYPNIKNKIGTNYTIQYKDNRAELLNIIDLNL